MLCFNPEDPTPFACGKPGGVQQSLHSTRAPAVCISDRTPFHDSSGTLP